MPARKGYSREAFRENVVMFEREGYTRVESLARAYKIAREAYFRRYPGGVLPQWLAYPGGKRIKNPSPAKRAAGEYWKAYRLARRAYADDKVPWEQVAASARNLKYLKAQAIVEREAREVRDNPVPASRRVQLREAGELYQDFSGHDPEVVARLEKPEYPDVVLSVGECDGVLYTTVRDGKTEKYIHRFRKSSRPLLAVSSDGDQLYLLGGAYKFTDRGITDK